MSTLTCAVRGMLATPSGRGPGAMCAHIKVGGKVCGFDGDCGWQRQPTEPNSMNTQPTPTCDQAFAAIDEKTRQAWVVPTEPASEPQSVTCVSCGGRFVRNVDGSIPCGH